FQGLWGCPGALSGRPRRQSPGTGLGSVTSTPEGSARPGKEGKRQRRGPAGASAPAPQRGERQRPPDGGARSPQRPRGLRGSNPFTRGQEEEWRRRNRTALTYIAAAAVGMVGMSYAAVPAAFAFAQEMEAVKERVVKVTFNADVHSSLQWNFRPQQSEIYVVPGETALAFYKAKNPTDKPIIGISTYNVVPFEAGQYFNKIQCFCFEEQRLNPQEEVDMPVFFYIDPEFAEDPKMAKVDLITLSYTFFEAKEGQHLPLPGYQ
uniref:Cytochrome c oxidase assembly protein COX11, mitochondrial n=1 Tax=Anas zonorhyncha TaxID=75864 RepID=A0A8B9VLQ3_9AVES